jgi:hypothetical protein
MLHGQTTALSLFNPIDPSSKGVHLYGVSVFSGYYSGNVPFGTNAVGLNTPSSSGSDTVVGGTATFGWAMPGKNSDLSATYSLSYVGRVRNPDFNTLNHAFSLGWTEKLGRHWSLSVSAGGVVGDLEQLFFTPTVYSNVVSAPASYDDLTAAILAGKYTNAQLASMLTGAPIVESPAQTFMYGGRVLSATLSTALTWSPTGRTSFHASVSGNRLQHLQAPGTSTQTTVAPPNALMPQISAASASLGWSYSLTPRTQIGVDGSTSRAFSRLQRGYASSVNVSFGRTLSRQWFMQANVGAGMLIYSHQAYAAPHSVQPLGSASLGYKTRSHTFLASYNRSLGDRYGLGSGSTSGATGAWNWRRPGTTWSVSSSFGYQELANSTFPSSKSWQANAGLGKALSRHVSMSLQYGYLRFPTSVTLVGANRSGSSAVLSLTWSPSVYR